jgi:hypothetical protein
MSPRWRFGLCIPIVWKLRYAATAVNLALRRNAMRCPATPRNQPVKKPRVYLETSAVSALWYDGADVAILARRFHAREWWDLERHHFALWTSAATEAELRAGKYPGQDDCVAMARRLRYLPPLSGAGRDLLRERLWHGIVPANKEPTVFTWHLRLRTEWTIC